MSIKSLISVALALGATAAQANLLSNAGFETVALPGQGWDLFTAIPGWTATTGKVEIGHGGIYGVTGFGGENVLELDSDQNSTIAQNLNLGAGTYTLTFDFAKRANTADETNMFDVLWNGNVVASLSPNSTAFSSAGYSVTAVAGMNTLAFRAQGTSDSYGGMVDNVNVQAVPAPSSLAAFAVGGLGVLRRRRKA